MAAKKKTAKVEFIVMQPDVLTEGLRHRGLSPACLTHKADGAGEVVEEYGSEPLIALKLKA